MDGLLGGSGDGVVVTLCTSFLMSQRSGICEAKTEIAQ